MRPLSVVEDERQPWLHSSLKDPFHQTYGEEVQGDIPESEKCHKSHQQQMVGPLSAALATPCNW